MSRDLRIAACQYAPRVGDTEGNRALATEWAARAAGEGAQLIVLPELASSGYAFSSEDEASATAAPVADSDFLGELSSIAERTSCHIVTGFNERDGDCRHNASVLVGGQGVIATYRKLHLFNDEQSWFKGGENLPVVDLPWGRLGMLICFDLWFPEVARTLAVGGAVVIAVPTNWVSNFKNTVYDERGWCQGDYVAAVTAAQNGVVMVCADRTGEERACRFLGASVIVGADGWPVAGPASATEDELLLATIDLDSVAKARRRTPRNHLLDDRRPETYNVTVVSPVRA